MKNYLQHWNFMRLLRLALGIFIVIQGIQTHDWIFIVLGGIFTILPIFNIGCCGASGCQSAASSKFSKTEEAKFEEIK